MADGKTVCYVTRDGMRVGTFQNVMDALIFISNYNGKDSRVCFDIEEVSADA